MKNMTESFSDEEMDTMISHFEDFRDAAQKAVMGFDKKDAHEKWRSLFGDDFPKYVAKQESSNIPNIAITGGHKPWGN
jgi:hypothetical protein